MNNHLVANSQNWGLLDAVPRVHLAQLPTPLEPMDRMRNELSAKARLFVKRDDLTGLAFGGNKARKLEFVVAAALAQGSDVLITTGGLQSNHVRQTAAAAAKYGLSCHAVVNNPLEKPPVGYFTSGNLLVDDLLGATVHVVANSEHAMADKVDALTASLRNRGRKPFVVPLGASDEIGSLGYVACARELLQQCDAQGLKPSTLVLCTGSGGTQAGLLAGLWLAGVDMRVVGIASSKGIETKREKICGISSRLLAQLGQKDLTQLKLNIEIHDNYVGEGYAVQTADGSAAIRLAARTEALILDPVYTGKAMAGMIDMLLRDEFDEDGDVIFLHTGGATALFAYANQMIVTPEQ